MAYNDNMHKVPELTPSSPRTPEEKAELLRRFLGPIEESDAEMADFWRQRSPAEHAASGAQLSDMAARMSVQTGLGKDPTEMFPGFPPVSGRHGEPR